MPNRYGMVIHDWMLDEIHWKDLDIPSYYPSHMIDYETMRKCTFKVDDTTTLRLTQCSDCKYCIKLRIGEYRCKYAKDNGKPKRETCKYERKKR